MQDPAAREAERKYDVPEGVGWPDLTTFGSVSQPREFSLRATYHDTPTFDLTRAGWELRRRTGGEDAGWHMKTPAIGDVREESRLPIDGAGVPADFRERLSELVKARPLFGVCLLFSDRDERDLVFGGRVRAYLCLDRVRAEIADGRVLTWREAEVELAEDEPIETLDGIAPILLAAGFTPSPYASKIARALADAVSAPEAEAGPHTRSGDVVLAFAARQIGILQSQEAAVRVDGPDAVHKSRVATRRLRSILRTYRSLLDEDLGRRLASDLKWYGALLGAPRDAEVLKEHLAEAIAELDPAGDDGPVAERMVSDLDALHDAARARLVEGMSEPRFATLSERLTDFLQRRPIVGRGAEPAEEVLRDLVGVAVDRVRILYARAKEHPGELVRWHDVRKAAKTVRYCTEATVDAFGEEAEASVERWTSVTEALGDFQDSVVAFDTLGDIAREAAQANEPTPTYRVLQKRQLVRRRSALDDSRAALDAALDPETEL